MVADVASPRATSWKSKSSSANAGARKKIGYYLRHCSNLHYFAAIRPYLDHFLQRPGYDHRIIVRRLTAGYEKVSEYAGCSHLFSADCDLSACDLVLTPTFLREHERSPGTRAVQIFHGMSDKPFTYQRDFSSYLLCLCVGHRGVDRLLRYEHNRGINWAMVGYPKFDRVPSAPRLFHNGRPTVIYCPTWRKGNLSSIEIFLNNPDCVAAINSQYNLIVKPHPNIFSPDRECFDAGVVERLGQLSGIRLVCSGNVMPWLAQADVFVGDVSAAGYEWLYFARPMIFLNPQPRVLRPSRSIDALTYLWQAGDVCDDIRDLKAHIDNNLATDRHHETREAILRYSVRDARDGKATNRAICEVEKLLTSSDQAALAL